MHRQMLGYTEAMLWGTTIGSFYNAIVVQPQTLQSHCLSPYCCMTSNLKFTVQCLFSYQNSTLHMDNQLAKHCKAYYTYHTPCTGNTVHVLCFAGWLSECTASHTAQNNTLWSNVEYFHHKVCIFLLCGVQFTYTLQLAA